jgi:putative transposase
MLTATLSCDHRAVDGALGATIPFAVRVRRSSRSCDRWMFWSRRGQVMADAIRQIGVSKVTYHRWRQEAGRVKIEQVKRLKELELGNNRLRKAVSDLTLDKLILQQAAQRNL